MARGARDAGLGLALHSKGACRSAVAGLLVFLGLAVPNDDCESDTAFCSTLQLLGKFLRECAALERRMQSANKYGAYYQQLFDNASTKPLTAFPTAPTSLDNGGRTPLFLASADSISALSRRILTKHLQAVISAQSVATHSAPNLSAR